MKDKDYRNSKFKHQLLEKKFRGQPYVIWSLTPERLKYVEEELGFTAVPYIFRIDTRTFSNPQIRNQCAILKEIHYAKKKESKSHMFKKLSFKEQKLLKEYDVYYTPVKYKIIFN